MRIISTQQTPKIAFPARHTSWHFCIVKEKLQSNCDLNLMFKYLLSIVLAFTSLSVFGQGWERIYSGGGQDEATDVALTPDGGYVLTGYYNGSTRIALIKVDVDGFLQWSKFFLGTPRALGNSVLVSQDSGYVVAGFVEGSVANSRSSYLMKTDAAGNQLWAKNLGVMGNDEFQDVIELADGSLVAIGFSITANGTEDVRVVRTDADGNLMWSNSFGTNNQQEKAYGVTLAANGDIVVVGERSDPPSEKSIYIVRLNPMGQLVWDQTYSIGTSLSDEGRAIVRTDDGHFAISGFTQVNIVSNGLLLKVNEDGSNQPIWFQTFSNVENLFDVALAAGGDLLTTGFKDIPGSSGVLTDLFIARTDELGNTIWSQTVGKAGPDAGYAVLPTPDGGAVAVGSAQPDFANAATYAYMARTDANGNVFTNYLRGNIFLDDNQDCAYQFGELGLKNWLLRIESPDFTRYATADAFGNYLIMVDTGTYNLQVFTPNDTWQACQSSQTVSVVDFYDTLTINVGVQVAVSCPRNEVDIQTPILRRCTDNLYTVRYCNQGTSASVNTQIKIALSPDLSITDASQAYGVVGDTVVFLVGSLLSGECKVLTFNAFLDCDADAGSAHCAAARILPDTFCTTGPDWDGSIIEARAECEDGRVKMYLKNKGNGPIGTSVDFVVIQDVIMLTIPPGTVPSLEPGQEIKVWDEAANNRTYRLIAEQTTGYPGMSVPTAAIEGCKTDTTSAQTSTGFYTMFPEDDAEPFLAADCQEAYEPDFNPTFLKRGHPKGYEAQHYITPDTELDYLIRFQNTSNDTVQNVVIRDTLSVWLDPATIRPGTASHPYTFQMYGSGIVQFTLNNLNLLPGSGEGYVKFRIAQQPDVPCETQIFNRAAVYFNYGAPVVTNQTDHTICDRETFIVATQEVHVAGATVKVFPNPFVSSTTFAVSGVRATDYQLAIYDLQGRLLFNQTHTDSTFQLSGQHLPGGTHFYRLMADGRPVASGKLIVMTGQ
jgi:hypothetical protein